MVFISVIITAYKRKEFIMDAIKSVLNQTLPRKYYEIIVVKNFIDSDIDKYINDNNIKNIFSNDISLSGKSVEAIKSSHGEIISFLDDDDMFYNNKLEYIYDLFKNNINLVYYHNNMQFMDENESPIKNQYNAPDFNTSSITIEKNIINIDNLKKIDIIVDTFFYCSALDSNKKIIDNKKILTKYRFHNSSSNVLDSNFDMFLKNKINVTERFIDHYKSLLPLFKRKKTINNIKSLIFIKETYLYSINKNYKPNNFLFKFLFYSGHKLSTILEFISITIFGNFARRILNSYRMKIVFKNSIYS